jgi:hypothetical protein
MLDAMQSISGLMDTSLESEGDMKMEFSRQ